MLSASLRAELQPDRRVGADFFYRPPEGKQLFRREQHTLLMKQGSREPRSPQNRGNREPQLLQLHRQPCRKTKVLAHRDEFSSEAITSSLAKPCLSRSGTSHPALATVHRLHSPAG